MLVLSLFWVGGVVYAEDTQTLIHSASSGDVVAQRNLGIYYLNGTNGFEKNYAEAKRWLDLSVAQGDKEACYTLGVMYTFELGVDKDLEKAVKLFKQAEGAHEGDAYSNLAVIYDKGLIGEKDPILSAKYYKFAADAGNLQSSYIVGWRYQNGIGLPKSYKKALQYYQKAASNGHVDAMVSLADMYDDGLGVKRDDFEVVKWYKKAADAGSVAAMTNLGLMYMRGERVKRDYAEARSYFEKATTKDSPQAMSNLGYLYLNGLGVKKDFRKASELYKSSCDKGEQIGCDTIKEMKNLGTYREPSNHLNSKSTTKRLIAKSIDEGVNATFSWQGEDAVFTANNGEVDCTFLKDFPEKAGILATSFVCTDNVQVILKQFKETQNAYLAITTDNFKTEVRSFSVNVFVTDSDSN